MFCSFPFNFPFNSILHLSRFVAILNTIEMDVYIPDWIFIDITSEKHYLHEHIHFGGLNWSIKIHSVTYSFGAVENVFKKLKFFIFNKMEISRLNKLIYSTRTVYMYMYHLWVCWYSQIKRITQRVVSMKSLNIACTVPWVFAKNKMLTFRNARSKKMQRVSGYVPINCTVSIY